VGLARSHSQRPTDERDTVAAPPGAEKSPPTPGPTAPPFRARKNRRTTAKEANESQIGNLIKRMDPQEELPRPSSAPIES
jgi:hypothetical protein